MSWDPDTYPDTIREEVADYDVLQDSLVAATEGIDAAAILDLGTGSGETARRILQVHPEARLCGIDSSGDMLEAARRALPRNRVELRLRRLEDPLPEGPFDLVVSALAVHHLEGPAKAELFARVAAVLRRGGRFVLADVVVPNDPSEAVIPIEPGYDYPSTIEQQLEWLNTAGLVAGVFWKHRDLAILTGDA